MIILVIVGEEKFSSALQGFSFLSKDQIEVRQINRKESNLISYVQEHYIHERFKDREVKWGIYVILS